MLRDKAEQVNRGLEIDLDGPEGNAFSLIGVAKKLGRQMDLDDEAVAKEMMSGDYEQLLEVFQKFFPQVTLWRTER